MKKFLDTDHPWFRPLWRRVLFTVLPVGWSVLEFFTGSPFWGTIFLGLAAFAGYGFFFDFEPGRTNANPPEEPPQQ